MATIWSLNYHEVLDDARVLKQARVLATAGHNLTVFSHFPEGRSKFQAIDGFNIHRFDWLDYSKLQEADKQVFEFLEPSSQPLLTGFKTLVDQVEKMRSLDDAITQWERLIAPLDGQVSVYEKRYYQEQSGLKWLKRRFQYKKAFRKLNSSQDANLREKLSLVSNNPPSKRELRELRKAARKAFREQRPGRGLIFAANLMREELTGQPDVIHAHDIYTLPAGVLLAEKYNCHLIYDAHELEIERATIPDEYSQHLVDILERACLEHVDALITVSDEIGNAYSERYRRQKPVIVMNAPELTITDDDTAQKANIRSMSGLSDNVPLVVFTGEIQREHRGVDKVLEALTYLPDVHLAILGPRHNQNDAWLVEYAQKLNVLDRVHIHEPVDARDVVAAISTASLSVIPFQAGPLNHEFAMPNKLFEAAFARVPLAVSNLTEMRRFVETLGIGRSMDQSDPKSIANAIQDILSNAEKYQGIPAIEEKLQDTYSWNAQAKKLIQLYDEILQPRDQTSKVG